MLKQEPSRAPTCYVEATLKTPGSSFAYPFEYTRNVNGKGSQEPLIGNEEQGRYKKACPDYRHYAVIAHRPYSDGPLALPFQRPDIHCRTFHSPTVEKVIAHVTSRMEDKDLARIFENAFPNTLDTTIRWHVDGSGKKERKYTSSWGQWDGAQSFVVTGDINAEWLRDSTNQLLQYQGLAKKEKKLENLILGAINTQAEYVIESPYCNAFQPPPPSHGPPVGNGQDDAVHPAYEPSRVFECKWEVDSLAHFLALGNQFHKSTGSKAYLRDRYYTALETVLEVLDEQSKPTFDPETKTLNLGGVGNPLANGTGLIRSSFRPSDDATILQFLIPANAQISVELKRTSDIVKAAGKKALAARLLERAQSINKGVWEHGVVNHKKYGEVFAFEVDGYGSAIIMDDANIPSLLALPLLGFCDVDDKVYQNTRKMILDKAGNPYYLTGRAFAGVGGPHIGLQYAWPMSRLVEAMTSNDDDEIMDALHAVKGASQLGLVHESVNVDRITDYTRSWFAWANSVFAQTILNVAARKPDLLFGKNAEPFVLEEI
ncbi:meiotically up-regulated protein [Physcia stellaris]|nr:meiotically up-regulated protein [Physcia stellaris]